MLTDSIHDRALLDLIHPPDWRNPEPAPRYNLVVLGGGTGGLVSAAVAAGLGAKVALVERDLLGGDCLNIGCVPSKALIRAGRLASEAAAAGALARPPVAGPRPDFAVAMERMREVRVRIAPPDAAARFRDDLGVDVFLGDGRFVAPDALEVDGKRLRFARAVLATGGRAAAPPIPGLAEAGYLTNATVFSLTAKPARLAVIGGGPIGCELAQTFARLGIAVTLFEVEPKLLGREDADAAAIVQRSLARDGVTLVLGTKLLGVARDAAGKAIRWAAGDGEDVAAFDEILVAAGRAPNVEGIGLEKAGVAFEKSGISIDDRLRTSNPRIYAVGDCALEWKFTHAADAAAKIAVQNALFLGRKKLSALTIPWCTYTDPELAHVGLYAHEAEARGIAVDTYTHSFEHVDRAICDGEDEGFVRIHVKRGTDRIVGATIVASHAGEMLPVVTVAMAGGLGLGKLAGTIFPYPTQADAIKTVANQYMRTRLTPNVKRIFETVLRWRR